MHDARPHAVHAPAGIGVLLVDKHSIVRVGLRFLAEHSKELRVVAEAGDAEAAYQAYTRQQPDVVVLEVDLPGASGLDAARRILARDAKARILVFSDQDTPAYLARARRAGALGFVSKRGAAGEVLRGIRTVARGEVYMCERMLALAERKGTAADDAAQLSSLTMREFEVLRLLACGKPVNECAEILTLSPKTVGHHYTRIKKKLGVPNSASLVRLAIRAGVVSA